MDKINLIIGREYWTRVKSKSFLLTTFLAPIGIVVVYGVLIALMMKGSDDKKNIIILDNAGLTEEIDLERGNLNFTIANASLEELFKRYEEKEFDGILELPALSSEQQEYKMTYHSDEQLALDESESIKSAFRKPIRNFKVKTLGIDAAQVAKIDTDLELSPKTILEKDKELSSMTSIIQAAVGGVVGTILMMVILLFGQQVMRGVNEEKINRIVEVIISSVKPIELMIGKVLGVGLVGLTQFIIWGILLTIISTIAMSVMGLGGSEAAEQMVNNEMASSAMQNAEMQNKMNQVLKELSAMNWTMIISVSFLFFIFGYLLYASLFAAVGAAVGDDVNEAQSLVMVVSLPLMAAFYIGFSALKAPNSSLAVWSSIFPLTAPVVMPFRLATEPPMWQVGLSILLTILLTFFMIWLASRIYRVGILMYGKKASFKELGKWIFYTG